MVRDQEAIIVTDLNYGDAGKGTITDFLAREKNAHTIIRSNGGAQAGHTVVTSDGRIHTFSQFSSGTFIPGVETHLSHFMILSPLALLEEEKHLRESEVYDALDRITTSEEAIVATPFHSAANRLRELARHEGRHGSCGVGVGETVSDSFLFPNEVIRAKDLRNRYVLSRKLRAIQKRKHEELREAREYCRKNPVAEYEIRVLEMPNIVDVIVERFAAFAAKVRIVHDEYLGDILKKPGCVLFEGAQGVLLDEWRGFHPYTTWSTCTFDNPKTLLTEHAYQGSVLKLGVVRAYATRHGPGPFVTEDAHLTRLLPDTVNTTNQWQREFRIGWFDLPVTKYAIEACGGIDALAVTCLDRLRDIPEWNICTSYQVSNNEGGSIEMKLGVWKDLEYQSALTEYLMRAKPVYEISATSDDFLERCRQHLGHLISKLGVPVSITSYGPRAEDKQYQPLATIRHTGR